MRIYATNRRFLAGRYQRLALDVAFREVVKTRNAQVRRLKRIILVGLLCAQPVSAQQGGFLSELFGQSQQPANAGQESVIAPWQEEIQEPVEEPSLREIVAQQLPFYPLLIAEKNYESSLRCLDQIQYLFDQKNEQGDFTILRQDYWLDVLLEVEMELYFCDGPMLRSYISKDRAVPARWYSVRTSLPELLKSTDQNEEDLVEIEPRWTE